MEDGGMEEGGKDGPSSILPSSIPPFFPYLYPVKPRITLFFMVLLVLTQTELHQVLKLPVFIVHFQEHRALNKDISLLDFFIDHYVDQIILDNDDQRDSQLPFKTTHCVNTTIVALSEPVQLDLRPREASIEREFNIHRADFPRAGALHNIFQPPRQA